MERNTPTDRVQLTLLTDTFERYLQDKGKGRGGKGGNYRRNVARELERFAEWATGECGPDDWTGIVVNDDGREPTFEELDERVFREYARYLAGDRGLKQNTVQTYYRYLSAWCGWCVNEGYTPNGRVQWRRFPKTTAENLAISRFGRLSSATPSPGTSTRRLEMPLKRSRHSLRIPNLSTDSEPGTRP